MQRSLIVIVTLGFLCVSLGVAEAQQTSSKVPVIGLLNPQSSVTGPATGDNLGHATVDSFRRGLQDLGYIEGQTIHIEYRWAEGHPERLADLAADLVRLQVDVIVTVSMKGVRAARQATAAIPIVSAGAGDLLGGGLIDSLARPGGNITGLTDINPELNGKLLQLLKAVVPGASRVAYLHDAFADPQIAALHLQEAQAAAQKLNLQLQPIEVRDARALDGVFAAMTRQDADALVTQLSVFTMRYRQQIVMLAAQSSLPAGYQGREFTEVGGLISYGTDRLEQWRRAAIYVDKILKGANPANLAVEQPAKLELVINLKTAKTLGLTLPPSILFQADEVIR